MDSCSMLGLHGILAFSDCVVDMIISVMAGCFTQSINPNLEYSSKILT